MTTPPLTPRWEVVREHAATGRSQLVAWNQDRDTADTIAFTYNHDLDDQGRTLAASGILEAGWVYVARPQGQPDAPPLNGVGKNGTPHNGTPGERGRRSTRRGRAAP